MKAIFRLIASLILPLVLTVSVLGQDSMTYSTTLALTQTYDEHEKNKDRDNKRMPAKPIVCTLSTDDGLYIEGYSNNFVSYEIWDEEGEVCLGSFANESEFINELFSMQGEYQLRFVSTEFTLDTPIIKI